MTDLHVRAQTAGLHRDWEDADGVRRTVGDDTLAAVLAAIDTSAPDHPFVTAVAGQPIALPKHFSGRAAVALDDGSEEAADVENGTMPPLYRIGYHRLRLGSVEIDLAVAPARCPPPPPGRRWGVAVQIPALRGPRPAAFGDSAALADTARALGAAGADALAISPTHALFPADPSRFSPYAPSTRLFNNILLGDPAMVGAPPPPEPEPDLIDWPAAIPARIAALRRAWEDLDDAARAAVAAWRTARGSALEDHARFDALHAHFFGLTGAKGWQDWPAAYHDPQGPAVAHFAAEHHDTVAFYAFAQWLAELGLGAAQGAAREDMAIGLVADLAVGMDSGGSHGWSRRGDLLTGLTIGAPPDPLGPRGQNWGITALDPFALRRTGYRAFIDTLRASLSHAGGLRIDHALGLRRLWVIPEGGSAAEGVYLSMPQDDLFRLVAIEAQRAGALIIAEDLGTVPPGFRDRLAGQQMLGMRVLPFERDPEGAFTDPATWGTAAVAMTGTHDTPTLVGWWRGRDLDWSERLDRSDTPEADREARAADREFLWHATGGTGAVPEQPPVDRLLAHVASAPCPLAIVPIEDLAALPEAPNLPGTIDEHPNWRRRLAQTTDALLDDPAVAARAALLSAERPR